MMPVNNTPAKLFVKNAGIFRLACTIVCFSLIAALCSPSSAFAQEGTPPQQDNGGIGWSYGFGPQVIRGTVRKMVEDSQGNLYIIGDFQSIGNLAANQIAMWDGTQWSNLGGGVNGEINAILIDPNDNVIVGGDFTSIGGASISKIARWNGSAWDSMGNTIAGKHIVTALARNQAGNLYALTNSPNSVEDNRIYIWNGTTWQMSSIPFTEAFGAIAVDGQGKFFIGTGSSGLLYVGDGTTWKEINGNCTNTPSLFTDAEGHLYGAGAFHNLSSFVMYDDSFNAFFSLPTSESTYASRVIPDQFNNFYILNSFFDGSAIVSRWNDGGWEDIQTLTAPEPESGFTDAVMGNTGNTFITIAHEYEDRNFSYKYTLTKIKRWDGEVWVDISGSGNGLSSAVQTMASDGHGGVYAGGFFIDKAGNNASNVLHWDGEEWTPMGFCSPQLA